MKLENLVRYLSMCGLLSAVACGTSSSSNDDEQPPPHHHEETQAKLTYYRDAKAVIDAKCAGCHAEGGIGPFQLDSFAAVEAYAPLVKSAVEAKTMPPWPADSACRPYEHDFSLSQEESDLLVEWVDLGAHEGDPNDAPPPVAPPPSELARVDIETGMAEPYTPAPGPGELDDFRCFLVDWPAQTDKYITGIHTTPSNLTVTHHLVAVLVPPEQVAALEAEDAADPGPGWDCGGGGGMGIGLGMGMDGGGRPGQGQDGDQFESLQGQGLLAGWVPGARASMLPPDTGMLVRPGSKILMNMHYNTLSGSGADQTTMRFTVEDSVAKPGVSTFWTNPLWVGRQGGMLIPAGESNVHHTFSFDPTVVFGRDKSLTVYSSMLHMHTFGKRGGLSIERANNTNECLVDVQRWDFDWQLTYGFMEPTTIQPGDRLRIDCWYDNSAANQPIVGGAPITPQDVHWGEGGTLDEMCLGAIFITR